MVEAAVKESVQSEAAADDPTPGFENYLVGTPNSPFLGKAVLVRTYSAGVHVGELEARDGTTVLLKNARRIWTWRGAFTLSEVATKGIAKSGSRMSVAVPMIELTQAIEILATTEEARASFDAIHE
jgi:hypothetical protein